MFQTEWPVLLVDDDPDVLAVSKLAMKSFEIDGVPIKLFTATSKDEAVKLLSGPLGSTALPYVSVAFIDVVMETDHAWRRSATSSTATTSTATSPRRRRPRTSSTPWSRRASGSSISPA
jgi:hypothetical protein